MLTRASGKRSLMSRSMSWAAMAIVASPPVSADPSGHEVRQPPLVGEDQSRKGKWRFARKFQGVAPDPAQHTGRNARRPHLGQTCRGEPRLGGKNITALVLAEPSRVRRQPAW